MVFVYKVYKNTTSSPIDDATHRGLVWEVWNDTVWMSSYFKEYIQNGLSKLLSKVSNLFTEEEENLGFWLHACGTIVSKPLQEQIPMWENAIYLEG